MIELTQGERAVSSLVMLLGLAAVVGAAEPDILIADFESDYGQWKATGEAFGPGPAKGTLPHQMDVSGYDGKGLVNSFYKGDGSTGTLTSAPFTVQRKYLNFLIGGGKHPGQTCINLLVDGKVVRTATGPNDRPGGSERLDWQAWDVGDLIGKQATLQIVDQATGGWGHINLDQIVQSNLKCGTEPASRELTIQHRYLHLPVRNGARKTWMRYVVDGQPVREFEIELAEGKPEFWMPSDVSDWKDRTLRVEIDALPFGSQGLASIAQADELPGLATVYKEPYRPQFHFSPQYGWTNDPNGMVYYDGEYHLFFQHNPYGTSWGNMTWGHAISTDLLHWQELPDAVYPDKLGTIFSGSAVVDWNNTAGFQQGKEKTLVLIYTAAGGTNRVSHDQKFTQAIAYSTDRGRTWTKYAKNPVLGHIEGGNRDPKVFWHEPSRQWVMALYLDKFDFALFASPDLKQWTRLCDIPAFGDRECPDFFELAVDGDKNNTRWLFWGASGYYLIGRFDGKTFVKESGPHQARWGANDYAAQTYSDIPAADGRRIQIAWMNGGKYPGMPFNQQMSIPRVFTLRTTPEGIRLFMEPVKELEALRTKQHAWKSVALAPGDNLLEHVSAELLDIEAELELGDAKQVGFELRGHKVEYSVADKRLTALGRSAPLEPVNGRIRLRILVDRTSQEVFADDGRVSMASCFLPASDGKPLAIYAVGGKAKITSMNVWELKSAWGNR
ncbi:MAG: glycoside hydrolase family 32 protein [Thermoguttaceae bacterium]